ncbi:hypothetical protein [Bradymonas sediminis]|uniref:Uncharacterized protein n=1 Tax=Bradymonas sediminis TaxID=1548548 RepID=A0A2Z4FQP2_9DELT|nr:hypothetical protein [Bradymonas sediminis]AWV91273.1 hypothetical protein DN745_18855 [Bradymonas sediminis]TDP73845.1 hypothetical protein DFR33_105177 [Bradymonas sediminis]
MNPKRYSGPLDSNFTAKTTRLRGVAGALVMGGALLWAGCAGPSGAGASNPTAGAQSALGHGEARDSDSESRANAGATLPTFLPEATSARVSAMTWGRGGHLRLGFADGQWVDLDAKTREATLHRASEELGPLVALSPSAEFAFIASTPPTVIRLRDNQVLFRLSKVKDLKVGGFFTSGAGFYAAEKSGALHVWKKSEKKLDKASTRDLKRVAMRQTADFSVGLPPASGQVVVTPDDSLVMGVTDGDILRWNLATPDQVDGVGRLPGAGKSLGLSQSYLVATTRDGQLRVIERARPVQLPWSKESRGEFVAASPKLAESFAVLEKSDGQWVVAMRDFKSGDYRWTTRLDSAKICGFEFSADARQLAICADSGILVLDTSTGALVNAFRRNGESLEWQRD